MDINAQTTPNKLEKYSFLWSITRLILAAIALFLGGFPLAIKLFSNPATYRLIGLMLTLSWLISGVVSVYLLYRWYKGGMRVFGGNNRMDLAAFWVTVISGINLGLVVILGRNIGMSISSNKLVFIVVGLIYLATAYHLYKKWTANGKKIF